MEHNVRLDQLRAAKAKGRQDLLGKLRASAAQKKATANLAAKVKPFGSGGVAADVAKARKGK